MSANDSKWNETAESEWRAFRDRFEVGQPIEGIVFWDVRFGLFVDIGHRRFLALAEWLRSDLRAVSRPAPGSPLRGVLPLEEREAFLQQALLSQKPYMAQVAVWRVRHLPLHKRGAFLQQALNLNFPGVAALAVGRVRDLPQEERVPFLQHVLQHEDQSIATRAVWQIEHLTMSERLLFLQKAALHPFTEVNERARFELGRLFSDESSGR